MESVLDKRDEVYWFEKGWNEFVENYSLDHGHLVVFKYKGTSKIDVIILDQSATEIDYPSYEDIHIVELKDDGLDQRVRPKSPLVSGSAGSSLRGNAILPISFFKIILKTNLARLKIPNKFTRIYGDGLANPVFIKPPDGTEWEVYWTKHNDEVWLEKGWKEFVERYSLDQGHLVVFKYKGTCHMDVLIHDQTALEINYPNIPPPYAKDNLDQNQSHHEIKSMDISGELPDQNTTQIRGEKSALNLSLNYPKEPRALEVARKFISQNPFFTVYIKHSLLKGSLVSLPDLKFDIGDKKEVTVKSGERSWNVKLLRCYPSGHMLSFGWALFAKESGLKACDICVFELINKQDLAFQVHVFRRDLKTCIACLDSYH